MKRRSFIKSLTKSTMVAPLLTNMYSEQFNETAKLNDVSLLSSQNIPLLEGMSSGVTTIDEITNGFHPKQLISVHGGLTSINVSLLFRIAFYNAYNRRHVDLILTGTTYHEYYKLMFTNYDTQAINEVNSILFGQNGYLRFPHIDLGDPRNTGWKDYLIHVEENPPDILLVDNVQYIEMFLHEKKMAEQLKMLAVELEIPVIVQPPPRGNNKIFQSKLEDTIRKDYERQSDVSICLIPTFVCNNSITKTMKYYELRAIVSSVGCPRGTHKGYTSEFVLHFNEIGLVFS